MKTSYLKLSLLFAAVLLGAGVAVTHLFSAEPDVPNAKGAAALHDKVNFTLVSFDTERDTPAALRVYRERQNLGTDHWSLLTGQPDDVRELAALLGVNYQKDARGQFAHSNVITVLKSVGEIAHQQTGLNQDILATVKAIEQASDSTKSKAHE